MLLLLLLHGLPPAAAPIQPLAPPSPAARLKLSRSRKVPPAETTTTATATTTANETQDTLPSYQVSTSIHCHPPAQIHRLLTTTPPGPAKPQVPGGKGWQGLAKGGEGRDWAACSGEKWRGTGGARPHGF
ncbi:hypothetical protein E2C01_034039 [Portunus trituberculatus]|uniref:Uncharacterized protein n=1 Tax=Portunus trituberculatus TaxID=210409 RepID=A0A5B7F5C4_PORTR|nr:hypothetical protein [Portunus trituberculatus]